jgi:hypothetical protein
MRLVYVPFELKNGLTEAVLVTDADGHPHAVKSGRVAIVGGPLCVVARWIGERDGRHRVRFQDGSSCWVLESESWLYDPADDVIDVDIRVGRKKVQPLTIGSGPTPRRHRTSRAKTPELATSF